MTAPSHLKSLQAVELAVRTGSLVSAADILAITPAAAGQRVKALEDFLGIELLRRGRHGIEPTAGLLAALPHLREGFAAIEAASAALELQRGHDLHITAPADFAELWLAPRMAAFRAGLPQLRVSINGSGDAKPGTGRADCEILLAGPEAAGAGDGDLLFHDMVLPLCSPANAERIRTRDAATRLEGFPLLHVDVYEGDPVDLSWPAWFARHGIARTASERGMRYRRIAGALDAIGADAGVALCGVALIADRLAAGAVALPYPDLPGERTGQAYVARYRIGGRARATSSACATGWQSRRRGRRPRWANGPRSAERSAAALLRRLRPAFRLAFGLLFFLGGAERGVTIGSADAGVHVDAPDVGMRPGRRRLGHGGPPLRQTRRRVSRMMTTITSRMRMPPLG
ncbi:LysR substrate-binding domain-containing protein [Sphingomonas quercus]|uniref:LysR family transcriptional regulator n=1 Tax=Sphingomonas quercus TaxID=2842451 RepID=A0ABS6BJQ3_9SPHN|nr:LysR substrate-binding domain-containing protein [Sphingomonas quercus]MBU3077469.1 LysR family transcriptional regulator [Sphingomonas quercus]